MFCVVPYTDLGQRLTEGVVLDYLVCVREQEDHKFLQYVSGINGKEVLQLVHRHEFAYLKRKRKRKHRLNKWGATVCQSHWNNWVIVISEEGCALRIMHHFGLTPSLCILNHLHIKTAKQVEQHHYCFHLPPTSDEFLCNERESELCPL